MLSQFSCSSGIFFFIEVGHLLNKPVQLNYTCINSLKPNISRFIAIIAESIFDNRCIILELYSKDEYVFCSTCKLLIA